MLTLADIKTRLGRKFRGASIDDIGGVSDYSLFEEAATNLLSIIDPYETVRLYRFNQFGGVYDYAAPSYLKGKKVIDPRRQDDRQNEDFSQTFIKDFDKDKKFNFGKVSVQYEDGIKVLRLSEQGKGSLSVDDTSAITGWSVAGGASNLVNDDVIRLDTSDTLRFDLGATGGYLEKSDLDTVDLTDFTASSLFRRIYLPVATALTSITLRIGSTSGNYFEIIGTPQIGSYRAGVNIVRFDLENATETGTVDLDAVVYEKLIFVTTAALTDVRVGPMTAKLPTPFEVPLYANQIFQDSTGGWLSRIEDSTDSDRDETEVVLEGEAENLFFYECCIIAAEDLSLDDEAEKYRNKLYGQPGKEDDGGLYGQYKRDKPGEALQVTRRWLNFRSRKNSVSRR